VIIVSTNGMQVDAGLQLTGAVSGQKIPKLFVFHVEASRQDTWV
jgi:hypothetical protein